MPDTFTQSADGTYHQFPDGTPQTVIDKAMKDYVTGNVTKYPGQEAEAAKNPPKAPGEAGLPEKSPLEMQAEGEETAAKGQAEMGGEYVRGGPGNIIKGVKDVAKGNIPEGLHEVSTGAGTTIAPLALAATPPMWPALAGGAALGEAGHLGGYYGAKALGASEPWADVAGDVGMWGGGYLGAKVGQGAANLASRLHYHPPESVRVPFGLGKVSVDTPSTPWANLTEAEKGAFMNRGYKLPRTSPFEGEYAPPEPPGRGNRPSPGERDITNIVRSRVVTPEEAAREVRELGQRAKLQKGEGLMEREARNLGEVRSRRAARGMREPKS